MSEASFTYTISEEQGEQLKKLLKERQFELKALEYGFFSAKRGKCGIHYYKSGKLLIQGKEAKEFIEFTLEPLVLGEARLGYEKVLNPKMFEPHFGIDESGKGDFFGPLVIAGAYVNEHSAQKLIEMGVKDSKKIQSDKKAMDLAKEIKKITTHEVISIGPERYNELYRQMRNLNTLLAWGHGKVIENLCKKIPACPRALSDQFAHPSLIQRELKKKNISIELEQKTKAESDIAVAAASILARAEFLQKLKNLGDKVDTELLKGAGGNVRELAIKIAQKHGLKTLQIIVKEHFKTFHEVQSTL
ncbi:MAG: ribonuclease HIII [Verrucomicrobiota bacterium]